MQPRTHSVRMPRRQRNRILLALIILGSLLAAPVLFVIALSTGKAAR